MKTDASDAAASQLGSSSEKPNQNGASHRAQQFGQAIDKASPQADAERVASTAGSVLQDRSGQSGGVFAAAANGSDSGSGDPQPKKKRRRRRKRRSVHARVPLNGGSVSAQQGAQHGLAQSPLPAHSAAQELGQTENNAGDRVAQKPLSAGAHWAPRNNTANTYAALDLGTNNCRLLVAVPTRPGQFRVVDAYSRIVRLGEGLGSTGRMSQAAMDRAVEALKACSQKLENRPVRRMRLIATEACRSAENGVQFLQRVRDETGLELEIVDRETEARLAVAGCTSLVERDTNGLVLFDIGGGSSEIALMDLAGKTGRLTDNIVAWTSLKTGVVTLAERFGGRDVTPEIFAQMKAYTADLLADFEHSAKLDHYRGSPQFSLLGTSGTVTTLAGIHLGLERYDRRRVDGLWMTSEQIDAINARLLGWSFEQRVANACIGADRADLVLAGCAILEAIRDRWPSQRLRVADRGLREGLLTEMMVADGVWRTRNKNKSRHHSQNQNRPSDNGRPESKK